MLGGIDWCEAAAILKLATESGMGLVDTSSAYGASETVIGEADHSLAVATKFGNPCELNGHTHDYSAEHCQAFGSPCFNAIRFIVLPLLTQPNYLRQQWLSPSQLSTDTQR